MKLQHLLIFVIAFSLIGCNKSELVTTNSDDPFIGVRNLNGKPIGKKVNGVVACTIDEDILRAAILDYYGLNNVQNMQLKEYHYDPTDSYYVIEGKIKNRRKRITFAFELRPVVFEGETYLYLPYDGVEQHVRSRKGFSGKLKVTSSTTGHIKNGSCYSVYSKHTSVDRYDDKGTAGLIARVVALQNP